VTKFLVDGDDMALFAAGSRDEQGKAFQIGQPIFSTESNYEI
jgi:hypothetical protein